jgi:hypothetical protein
MIGLSRGLLPLSPSNHRAIHSVISNPEHGRELQTTTQANDTSIKWGGCGGSGFVCLPLGVDENSQTFLPTAFKIRKQVASLVTSVGPPVRATTMTATPKAH